MSTIELSLTIPPELAGTRLDRALAQLLPDYSRAQIQTWIKSGYVQLNTEVINKTRHPVAENDQVHVCAEIAEEITWQGQAIDLDIIYQDQDIIIVNKAAGQVVHPGAGNPANTLVNALLHHDPELRSLPRAGLIHRLDKDTTGLLVVARNLKSHNHLVTAMQDRAIKRHYNAIVKGVIISGGVIDEPIGRHPTARTKMAVHPKGKAAITHYRVKHRYRAHTALDINLESGRTHQIRVHMTHLGYPLVGDKTYNKQKALESKISPELTTALAAFPRQALHATTLTLAHPVDGGERVFSAPLPDDLATLLQALQTDLDLNNSA